MQSSTSCPVCGEQKPVYQFMIHGSKVMRCTGCGLLFASPSSNGSTFSAAYGPDFANQDPAIIWTDSATEQDAANGYIEMLRKRGLPPGARLLLIAPPAHVFCAEAERAGFPIHRHETAASLEQTEIGTGFDAAVCIYQLEKSPDPVGVLRKLHAAVRPGGLLMVVTPSLDSNSARFFKNAWTEWRPENRVYFNRITLQMLLWRSGFMRVEIRKDRRKYTMAHINDRARAFPGSWVTRTIKDAYRFVPGQFRERRLRLPSSGIIACAVRAERPEKQVCSLVVPAYNESKTFPVLMDALLAKKMPEGVEKEIVIVESNSKDGTREQVLSYQDRPEIKIILQDRPNGKGNAVRAGFEHASGDIVIIQDADLEYDLNDIDVLIEPITKYQAPFVLGARHGGKWKMRQFENEEQLSTFFNFGHLLFTTLLNLIYGQRLKDPFTMYKVFHRDCLHGLYFECNRFDFDFELVIKLARKGYRAVEIPVNYSSRSFKEGKKIRIFRDPLTWIRALVKYRFASIYKEGNS